MRNVVATALQLAALAGISVAAFLVWLPLGLAVASVAAGVVGVAVAPERKR